jgi:hypothetical protein
LGARLKDDDTTWFPVHPKAATHRMAHIIASSLRKCRRISRLSSIKTKNRQGVPIFLSRDSNRSNSETENLVREKLWLSEEEKRFSERSNNYSISVRRKIGNFFQFVKLTVSPFRPSSCGAATLPNSMILLDN